MFVKLIAYLLINLFLFACASGHKQTSMQLRQYLMTGEFDKAIAYLKASPLSTDNNSKLLYFTELGLLEHYRGDFEASINSLNSAKELLDQLYTTRVSKKIGSFVSNDNNDIYYGEKYEASLVHFYLSLNYYMMGMKEPDETRRKTLLGQARAEVVAWDSFLSEIKKERLGKALFKEDLLAKTFGALVHESQGNYNDDQIALQLYKDAKTVFFRNYNLFPTFNASFESFRKNFTKLPSLSKKEVEGKYILATEHSSAFEQFLETKIKLLSSRMKKGKNKFSNEGNISFLVQQGLINEKVPQKYEIPMGWGAHESMALSLGIGSRITFELPSIQGVEKQDYSRLQALDEKGTIIKEVPLSVIAPLSELADQAINEHSTAIASKTAARVITKHSAAIAAAAVTYQAGLQKNDSIMMMVAMVGHSTAVASINASEKADVRHWSTLPSSIRMGHLSLPEGKYKFQVILGNPEAQEYRVLELGEHEVKTNSNHFIANSKDLKSRGGQIASKPPIQVIPESNPNDPAQPPKTISTAEPKSISCMKDSECPSGSVCVTVRGEYPGSCAGTGFFGKVGRGVSSSSSKK